MTARRYRFDKNKKMIGIILTTATEIAAVNDTVNLIEKHIKYQKDCKHNPSDISIEEYESMKEKLGRILIFSLSIMCQSTSEIPFDTEEEVSAETVNVEA